jgi:hypothetical protein
MNTKRWWWRRREPEIRNSARHDLESTRRSTTTTTATREETVTRNWQQKKTEEEEKTQVGFAVVGMEGRRRNSRKKNRMPYMMCVCASAQMHTRLDASLKQNKPTHSKNTRVTVSVPPVASNGEGAKENPKQKHWSKK